MNLALYETSFQGHRGIYALSTITAALDRGWSVFLFASAKAKDEPLYKRVAELVDPKHIYLNEQWIAMPPAFGISAGIKYQWDQFKAAHNALCSTGCRLDFVYASNLDYMDKAIALLGTPSFPVPFGGMTMRVRFHFNRMGVVSEARKTDGVEEALFRMLLRRRGLAFVTTADPSLAAYCQRKRSPMFRKVSYVPEIGMKEPLVDKRDARAKLAIPISERVVLIYGAIEDRKAVHEAIKALGCIEVKKRPRLLLVGRAPQSFETKLASTLDAMTSANRVEVTRLAMFADPLLEATVFAAADVVWVAYRNHLTMSGVFFQAAAAGLPVVAPTTGLASWLTSQNEAGIIVDIDDPHQTGRLIDELLSDHNRLSKCRSAVKEIGVRHSPENLGISICRHIEDAVSGTRSLKLVS